VFEYGLPFTSQGGVEGMGSLPGIPDATKFNTVQEFYKALQAGTGVTDPAALTGGAALRRESLESTLYAVLQQFQDFRLWNLLDKTPATATVHSWTEETALGGFLGGGYNSELGDISANDAELRRRVLQIKYLMDRRAVSFVKELEGGIAKPTSVQQTASALYMLSSAEWGLFEGDSAVNPLEFDGIHKLITSLAPDNVKDLEGQPIGNSAEEIVDAAERITSFGNFGTASHGFWSTLVQADLDKGLDAAMRVHVTDLSDRGLIQKGAPVVGIRSSFAHNGAIKAVFDKFILEGQPPAQSAIGAFKSALNTGVTVPVSIVGTPSSDAASNFKAAHVGNYYYAVEATNKDGRSNTVVSSQVAVAAGDKVTVVITPNAGTPNETGYVIHRTKLNGSNALTSFRQMIRVAKGVTTTTYIDLNRDMPGTSKALILNMTPGMQAMEIKRLLPMMKFPLFPTAKAEMTWAQLLFFALMVAKPQQHLLMKNIVPRQASFKPF